MAAFVASPSPAQAACPAPPPGWYAFKQMIRHGATNSDYFDRMIIGRVTAVRDPGGTGGRAVAVLHVLLAASQKTRDSGKESRRPLAQVPSRPQAAAVSPPVWISLAASSTHPAQPSVAQFDPRDR